MASAGRQPDPEGFYIWQPPSKALSIHLSLNLVKRLHLMHDYVDDILGPGELAGVLLGHSVGAPQPASFVEDFRVLSNVRLADVSPDESFIHRLRELHQYDVLDRRTIGCFRWQYGGWLGLTERDLEAANKYFPAPEDLILLIRSSERKGAEAAFFWRENGRAPSRDSAFEFPFEVGKLALPHAPPPFLDSPEAHPVSPPADRSAAPSPAIHLVQPIQWARLVPTAALAIIVTGTGLVGFDSWRQGGAPAATEPPPKYESPLGLEVTSQVPQQLIIRWNRDSKAVSAAKRGSLEISDGQKTEVAEVDLKHLRDGYVAYGPASKDVNIRLEIQQQDGRKTSESVRFLTPR